MADYKIWFRVSGYDVIPLPVNPSDVTISYPGNPSNYDVEGLGEIIIPRIPKLATVSFESFFPREKIWLSMVNYDSWYPPEWYVNFFRNIQKSRQPFELTIARGYDTLKEYDDNGNFSFSRTEYFDTVLSKAVLLDLSISDKGGEPGDVYYNMSISEYRDASPKTLAELAEEETDDEGNVVAQKMVLAVNRPQQDGAVVAGRTVNISGKVYELPEETTEGWDKIRDSVSHLDATVMRVLPPSVSGITHSVYVNGLGWVDKGNCKLAEGAGSANGINRLVRNSYD